MLKKIINKIFKNKTNVINVNKNKNCKITINNRRLKNGLEK